MITKAPHQQTYEELCLRAYIAEHFVQIGFIDGLKWFEKKLESKLISNKSNFHGGNNE
jgi:hypothetical protein